MTKGFVIIVVSFVYVIHTLLKGCACGKISLQAQKQTWKLSPFSCPSMSMMGNSKHKSTLQAHHCICPKMIHN
jgi:hypothetical protein